MAGEKSTFRRSSLHVVIVLLVFYPVGLYIYTQSVNRATAEDINDTVGLIAQHTEADIVTTVLTKGHPLQPVFRQLGFWPVKTRSNLVAYALADGLPSFEAKGWALSGCDIDTQ